jgi:hypothetical protein
MELPLIRTCCLSELGERHLALQFPISVVVFLQSRQVDRWNWWRKFVLGIKRQTIFFVDIGIGGIGDDLLQHGVQS